VNYKFDIYTAKVIMHYFFQKYALVLSPDSVVCITTRYELDGSGIESRRSEFFVPVQTGPVLSD
jgi:hypothetical protein